VVAQGFEKIYYFIVEDIYQYTDYREYLRDWFAEAKGKSEAMSYRYLAGKVSLDPGFLVHILQGHKHLAEKHIPALVRCLRLSKPQAAYFERLCLFGKARSEAEIARRFKELMELRAMQSRTLASKQYQYYEKWYIPVVRCLIAARGFSGDYGQLAQMLNPGIQVEEAKHAVKVLLQLSMLKRHPDGTYEVTDTFITTGDNWRSLIIRDFQHQTMSLAQKALSELPKEDREISTMTIAVPRNEMHAMQEMTREFRQKILRWALDQPDADSVIQFNIQIFPVVKP